MRATRTNCHSQTAVSSRLPDSPRNEEREVTAKDFVRLNVSYGRAIAGRLVERQSLRQDDRDAEAKTPRSNGLRRQLLLCIGIVVV